MEREDELICLGHDEDLHKADGAIMPPIIQTSLFAKPRFEDLLNGLAAEHEHSVYSRGRNPTVMALEKKLAALERGQSAKCFASGMGAISAVFLGLLKAGDHLLFVNHIYGPTIQLANHLGGFGIRWNQVSSGDLLQVAEAVQPETRIIYFESPGTMLFRQLDIRALAALARERNILTVLDNTWATPLFQKPLTMDVDLVVHSCSKYIGGHSDTIGGVVVGPHELVRRIFFNAFMLNGATPAPMDAFLLIRGLRTLPSRLRVHEKEGLKVAEYLAQHKAVKRVFHPGLIGEDTELSAKQLSGYSGLFSFELEDDAFETIRDFINHLRLFRIGVSWGGVESLIISPNRGDNHDALRKQHIPSGIVRLSVGLEGADALIEDLDRSLQMVSRKRSPHQ